MEYQIVPHESMGFSNSVCIYCNHCQPCPEGIDIGAVNKLFDQAEAGDRSAWERYRCLERHACDCTECGICERNCPFHVTMRVRMREVREFFCDEPCL